MEELEQVRRAQAGDRAAFDALVRATARTVWACVYGRLRDPAWTEDLVQETYAKAWESMKELREPGAFRGWLFSIARRLAWRRAERDGRWEAMPEVAAPGMSDDPEEARERIHAALARLPERYRLPLTLRLLNGMESGAIGRQLGIENGSLRGLLARGMAKLRTELAPWWRKRHEHP